MKAILTTIIFLFYSCFCVSQIIITSQQSIQPNDSIYLSNLDTTGFSPGNSGANVLWDFSNVNVLQYNAYEYFYLPTNSAICFNDTVNMYLDGHYAWPDYSYSYYYSDSTVLIGRGYCYQLSPLGGGGVSYSDPPLSLVFPFNYLDSFSDSSIGVLQHSSSFWTTNGTSTRNYDSYGELRLPWGTFTNTARLYSTFYNKDSIINASSSGDSLTVTTGFSYAWYDLNSHGSILEYIELTKASIRYNGMHDTTIYKYFRSSSNSLVGIKEDQTTKTTFVIYPNPSKGILNIEIPGQFKNEPQLELTVYDVLGKIIFTNQLSSISKVSKIDLPIKKKGLYLVSLSNQRQIITSKLSIE